MKYHLAEACKNTFVLFDCLNSETLDDRFFHDAHQSLHREKRDDALILAEGKLENDTLSAHMIVLGLDGALGEFCGNGSRAVAAYLFKNYPQASKFSLRTSFGRHFLKQYGNHDYSITLPMAKFALNEKFIANKKLFEEYGFRYVEMIEPHLTIEKNMNDEELLSLGRTLNQRRDIFPLGININAWHVLSEGVLSVKTYERGVQRLTQSCGTGSMSCACCYTTYGKIDVFTPGGKLNIRIDNDGIELRGPAYFDIDDTRFFFEKKARLIRVKIKGSI